MANKSRAPMQVALNFEERIKDLQMKIRKSTGKNMSLRELTEKISKSPDWDNLEKNLLKIGEKDISINLDRRKR